MVTNLHFRFQVLLLSFYRHEHPQRINLWKRTYFFQIMLRYRAILFRSCSDIIILMQGDINLFKTNTERGRWGLREGQIASVASSIRLFDQSWKKTSRESIIKSWLKSNWLAIQHEWEVKSILCNGDDDMIDIFGPMSTNNRQILRFCVQCAVRSLLRLRMHIRWPIISTVLPHY